MKDTFGSKRILAICLVITILLANSSLVGLANAAEPKIIVSGRLLVHHMGSPTGDLVPIPNARVEIYDEEIFEYLVVGWQHLPWIDTYLGAVYTDSNGYFSFSVNNDDGWTIIGDEKGRDIYLKIMASNRAAAVKDEVGWLGGSIYSFKTNTNKNMADGATWNIGQIEPDNADCEVAFEVMYIADLAWRHIKEETGIELRKVNIFIDDYFGQESGNSYYLNDHLADYLDISLPHLKPQYYPAELIAFLTGLVPEGLSPIEKGMINDVAGIHLFEIRNRSTEGFYEVVFHEYGHHIMYEVFEGGPPFTVDGSHSFTDEFNPEHAWVEGWAEYYSCIASERYGIDYTQGLGDIEPMTFDYDDEVEWDSVEGNIASILWDITDPANEAHDSLSLGFGELVSLIENFDPRPDWNDYWPETKDHVWDIHDLFKGFISRFDSQTTTKLWIIMDAHGISEPDTTSPNNPTAYTSTHSSVIGSSNTNIQVDLLGASDDISGVKEYFYLWENRPDVINVLTNQDWASQRETIETFWSHSESPNVELEQAVTSDYYLFVTVFDHTGNWAGDVFKAGPFLVRENPGLLLEGLIINSQFNSFITSSTTLQIDTPTYPGKDFTGAISLRLPDIEGDEFDYTAPLSFGALFGSESGDYNLEIKFIEETGDDEVQLVQFKLDNTPPTVNLQLNQPSYLTAPTYISRHTELTITATDVGVGLDRIDYRIFNSEFDSGWMQYLNPVHFTSLPDGEYTIVANAKDKLNNQASSQILVFIDNSAPQTEILIGTPQNSDSPTAVSQSTTFSIEGTDTGTGIANKKYQISTAESEGTWTEYTSPFTLSGKPNGNYIISQLSVDRLGNTKQSSVFVFIDNSAPTITSLSVPENSALQGNIHISLKADDPNGVASLKFSITQINPSQEAMMPPVITPATYDPIAKQWILEINTVQLKDGYYRIVIETMDLLGNEGTREFEYTIRNFAIINLSHFTENCKAGRTIPIKFSLCINNAVDETQPVVYNEELEIQIFKTSNPSIIIQTFKFGPTSDDYRISEDSGQYICNFKTLKTRAVYTAQIMFNGLTVGILTFQTN